MQRKDDRFKWKKIYGMIFVLTLALACVGCSKPNSGKSDSQSENQVTESTEKQEESVPGVDESELSEVNVNENSEIIETEVLSPADEDLVLIDTYIPNIFVDLKYATTDNFTGVVIYENDDAYLRYGTVKKLKAVQEQLNAMGYSLLIWDAYRPVAAQFKLWDICPDSTYVANPNKGFSKHSRGNTVDITLVTLEGKPVEMPTGFDDFTEKADRDYSDVSATAAKNSQMLEDIMTAAGFKGYSGEWWHYSDTTEYPVVE